MKKLLSVVLVVGFLFVDFLFFHDVLKQGEVTTLPQYLTGVLSVPVIIVAVRELFKRSQSAK